MSHRETPQIPGPVLPDLAEIPDEPLRFPDRPGPFTAKVIDKDLRNTQEFIGNPFPWPRGTALFVLVRNSLDEDVRIDLHGALNINDRNPLSTPLHSIVVGADRNEPDNLNPGSGDVWAPVLLATATLQAASSDGRVEVFLSRIGV